MGINGATARMDVQRGIGKRASKIAGSIPAGSCHKCQR